MLTSIGLRGALHLPLERRWRQVFQDALARSDQSKTMHAHLLQGLALFQGECVEKCVRERRREAGTAWTKT